MTPTNDGTAVNPIRFIADTDGSKTGDPGTVTISQTGGAPALDIESDDYIEFVGFRLGSDGRTASWQNSTGGLLKDCDIFQATDEAEPDKLNVVVAVDFEGRGSARLQNGNRHRAGWE